MRNAISKKIISFLKRPIDFYTENLPKIVFLLILLFIFSLLQNQPYFNLLSKYNALQFGLIGLLIFFLFRKYIFNKLMLYGALCIFIIAIPLSVLGIQAGNDILGFAAFAFLTIYILRRIYKDRKILSEIL